MSSRGDRWYIFQRQETGEYDITGWSREGARTRVDKLDPGNEGKAFRVWATDRAEARKTAVEVFGVKVRGYISPEDKRVGRAIVKAAVVRQIFCPYTGQVLDMRRAVVVSTDTISLVMTASRWDSLGKAERDVLRSQAKVYDGRELFRR